jgi:hypothetical protein
MLKLQIPKNRVQYLTKQMQMQADAATLEQGWAYYHKGNVREVELIDGLTVRASVKGNRLYITDLRLDHFAQSECSCGLKSCKHMAAVLYNLYSPYGRPELLLQEMKRALLVRQRQQDAHAAKADRKAEMLAVPQENSEPKEWHRFFVARYRGFAVSHQYSFEMFYASAVESLSAFAAEWHPARRLIYEVHVMLFVMQRIELFLQDTTASYLSSYHEKSCKQAADQAVQRTVDLFGEIADMPELDGHNTELWQETLRVLGKRALTGKESFINWITVYRAAWCSFAGKPSWTQAEIKRLETKLLQKKVEAGERDALLMARAHFDIMDGNAADARAWFDRVTHRKIGDFLPIVQDTYEQQDWHAMLEWLRWLLPSMGQTSKEDFHAISGLWVEAVQHTDADDEWVFVMESLLPRSYPYYTAYLLRTRRYRKWVDLQLANRISPANLYGMELRTVEENEPQSLLPLYHHAIERSVLEKNRTSYGVAIMLLKKLSELYRRMGRQMEWDAYMYRLSARFARLRAFQDELKKGKWVR